ncbi:MAG: site-specific integrase [Bacteroidales bacterium]|nr:site-specific integrase [Bacteroidales bacterium]
MKFSLKFRSEQRKNGIESLRTEKVPLYADIRFAGQRLNYFTGYKIDSVNFDSLSGRVKKNSSGYQGRTKVNYSIINGKLIDIEKELKDIFEGTTQSPDKEVLKSKLAQICCKAEKMPEVNELDFFQAFNYYVENCSLSFGRKKHVKTTINHWRRFEAFKKAHFSFNNITPNVLAQFESYLKKNCLRPKSRSSKELILSPISRNTIHSIMKMTRTFWNDARKRGITDTYPFKDYEIPAEVYGTPVYITLDERDLLYHASIENEKLARVRDVFLFQCYVGARIGDLCKLTKGNVNNGVLSYIPRKTKDGKPVTVTIPLSERAKEIISRYDLPGNMLLPFISDQRYNDYLKELFSHENIRLDRIVTRLNPLTREPEQVRLCDIASSHLARRTFIGNLFGKVDSDIICSMSGHVQGSRAFSRYHDVSVELQKHAIDLLK